MDSRTCIHRVRECDGQSVQAHDTVYIGFVDFRSRVCGHMNLYI